MHSISLWHFCIILERRREFQHLAVDASCCTSPSHCPALAEPSAYVHLFHSHLRGDRILEEDNRAGDGCKVTPAKTQRKHCYWSHLAKCDLGKVRIPEQFWVGQGHLSLQVVPRPVQPGWSCLDTVGSFPKRTRRVIPALPLLVGCFPHR